MPSTLVAEHLPIRRTGDRNDRVTSPQVVHTDDNSTIDRSGAVVGISAYLIWGLLTLFWKLLGDFAPLEMIGFRITMSLAMLSAYLLWRRRLVSLVRRVSNEKLWGRIAIASVVLTVNWTSYVVVVAQDHVVEAALGYFIAPLATMTIGVRVLGERMRTAQIVTASLGLASVLVLTVGYGRVPVYALLIAGSWSTYGYLKRTVPLSPIDSLAAETMILVIPALALVVWHLQYSNNVFASADGVEWTAVLLLGVITVVPLTMFAYAAQRIPMTVIGPMQYSVPVINFLLGWLAFGEDVSGTKFAGFSLVWLALVVLTVDTVRRARASGTVG
ncbi:MAG: EamA family transporter RarD [Acidimicrobiia bacterium]|jgi:chloramphenicol-sensitive protein RarD|nr:EamA family transporter RarD [Acidimicrobiia bacterium]